MFSYKDYITKEDLVPRGYILDDDNVLDITHFNSKEDAIDDFMQNAFDIIESLVVEYRGREFADAFFTDMKRDDLTGKALEIQNRLKKALIEQNIYTYDNGDPEASKYVGEKPYAPKAVKLLWGEIL
jgi:hypothetical protein